MDQAVKGREDEDPCQLADLVVVVVVRGLIIICQCER
jgi:hypothetical protein